MTNEIQNTTAEIVEVLPNHALEAIERASVDMQITTAHKFPRSVSRFKGNAIALATIDEETAESCIYKRPVGKDKQGREVYAEGMSIRMAEIVGASYGNLRVAARIIAQTDRQVVAQGVAHDLETNFASTSEVIEATVDRFGRPYNERMRIVIAKAALAKARRDATFQVVPRAIAKPVEHACKELLFGNTTSVSKRRERVMSWISKLSIDVNRIWAALNVGGIDDVGIEELETLTGLKTAIQNNEITLDEAFPDLPKKSRFDVIPGTVPEAGQAEQAAPPAQQAPPPAPAQQANPVPPPAQQAAPAAPPPQQAKPAAKSSVSTLAKGLLEANAPISVADCMEYCRATGQFYDGEELARDINRTVKLVLDWRDSLAAK